MTDESSAESAPQESPPGPRLTVVQTHATAAEVAAVTAVLTALGGAEPAPASSRPQWVAPERRLRLPPSPGPGAWRASALPR